MYRIGKVFLALACALGIMVACAAPAYAKSGPIVVTMGDSYASGEGIEPFYGQDSSDKFWNQDWVGHRSELSYSGQLVIDGVQLNTVRATPAWGATQTGLNSYLFTDDEYTNDGTWFFVAASASSIDNVYGGSTGTSQLYRNVDHPGNEETGEVSYSAYWDTQTSVFDYIDKTYGKNATDYVILNVGGVDLGLVQTMIVAAFTNATSSISTLNLTINGYKSGWNLSIRSDYIKMVNAIREAAGPQVKIIAVGYPLLFDGAGEDSNISAYEMNLLDSYMTWIDTQMQGVAADIKASGFDNFYYVSTLDAFKGHGMNSEDSYLVPIIFEAQDEDIDHFLIMNNVSPYTLHPNAKGASVIAAEVQKVIDEIEAGGDEPHAPGWAYENGSWYYYKDDGTLLTNEWVQGGGKWYYFGADGKLVYSEWVYYGGKWYFLNSSGNPVFNNWVSYGGKWYFVNKNGNPVVNDWVSYGGKWYFVNKNGNPVVNDFVQYAGYWFFFDKNGNPVTNQWVDYAGYSFYFNESGICVDWKEIA